MIRRTVPLEVTDGSAKQCWVAEQLPFEVSNCPFTQVAMASLIHVVSPSTKREDQPSLQTPTSRTHSCRNL